ncbi:hypothetical protein NU10_01710 [Flavobacterium dauae]|uniref:hypothetical protein n=1 Tax=Flavobacterium dauae TaxID=1563479 RepID=UPI00101BB0EF|nr:hypothetical protein [Flavobacterium dauae]WLD24137.1 hypothetical protein NU10_01710 [Flavobacterium dauae]
MKNTLTIIFILLNFKNLKAQTFKGVIKNSETKEVLTQITIISEDQSFFVTSNEKGEVVLPNTVLNKKLFINDYEYVYSEKVFNASQNFVWELTPNSETLEEIVIYDNLKSFLKEVIDNSIKSFSRDIILKTYCRENYLENNQLACLADGLVDFSINSVEDVQSSIKQSRVKEYIDPTDEFSRQFNTSPANLAKRSMLFNFIKVLIKDKNYEFSVTAKLVGNKKIHTCYITPKEKSKKRFLYSGYFTFDEEKKLILETNFAFAKEKLKYNKPVNSILIKMEPIEDSFESKYLVTDNLYYPTYAKYNVKLFITPKSNDLKTIKLHSQSSFYTLETNKLTGSKINASSSTTLYRRGTLYNTEFWNDPEISTLSE